MSNKEIKDRLSDGEGAPDERTDMEEKILDFIMEYAQENENVPFQVIEETFNIQMDESLRSIISDAIWDRDNVSDVVIENEGYVISCFED